MLANSVSSSTKNRDRNRLNSLNENKQVRVNILNMLFNRLIFFFVFFLLISASLLPTSMAGRPINPSAQKLASDVVSLLEETSSRNDGEFASQEATIHERVLRVNTKDYGRYDPAPTLVKPPFKLIPN